MGGQNYSQKTSEKPLREYFRILKSSENGVDTYVNRNVENLNPEQRQQFEQAKQIGKGKEQGGGMYYKQTNQITPPQQSVQQNQAQVGAIQQPQVASGQYLPPILQQPQTNTQSTLQPVSNANAANMGGVVDPSKTKQQSAQQIGAATSTAAQPTMTTASKMANVGAGGMQQQTNQFTLPTTNGLKFGGS